MTVPESPSSPRRRIAIFGGTFDPVHDGHLSIAMRAVELLEFDEVRFLPCRISPHKPGSEPTAGRHRLEMLRIATAGLPWAVVDDYELRSDRPSYSYLTAEAFRARDPDAHLTWLMGTDQWHALPRWKEPGRLADVVDFLVFGREGVPQPRSGWDMTYIASDHPASATAIRLALSRREEVPWLAAGVLAYIRTHHLYEA